MLKSYTLGEHALIFMILALVPGFFFWRCWRILEKGGRVDTRRVRIEPKLQSSSSKSRCHRICDDKLVLRILEALY
jgi:hypothetical protein